MILRKGALASLEERKDVGGYLHVGVTYHAIGVTDHPVCFRLRDFPGQKAFCINTGPVTGFMP